MTEAIDWLGQPGTLSTDLREALHASGIDGRVPEARTDRSPSERDSWWRRIASLLGAR
jgi:hypothetical protein